MGIGTSIVLIAVGAVLRWAIHWSPQDVSVSTIGLIVFLVGIVGLIASMALWGPWSTRTRSRRRVVDNTTGQTMLNDETTVDSAPRGY